MKNVSRITSCCNWIIFFALLSLTSGCAKKNYFPESPLVPEAGNKQKADSVTVQAGKQYKHSKLYNLFLGTHYREVWATPVQVRVLDFKQAKGGLEVQKKSGGLQTLVLTLENSAGQTFALRSVDKDPALNKSFLVKKTFGSNFMRDQTAALNPYAALVVAPLANATGIIQPNPELVYVRKEDPGLGKFKDIGGDRLYTLEEKYTGKKDIPPVLKDAVELAGTKKMLREIYEEDDHVVDQLAFAKARLFDIFINDRDRHQDQWEWAVSKESGNTIYKPIAKDRDQAFYNYSKGLTAVVFGKILKMQKFQPFKGDYRNLHALTVKSTFIDRRIINMVTLAQFDSLAKDLQRLLTDEVIEQAVRAYPQEVYQLIGQSTTEKLKSRRDKLPEAAAGFYSILATEVTVAGSDDEEVFEVKRLNDNQTEVTIYRKSDGRRVYHRMFNHAETKVLKLYGLGNDDEFIISGTVRKGIPITLVGGEGEDKITDTSCVAGWSKKTIVYDTRRGNEIKSGPDTKEMTSHCVTVHDFDREGY